MLKIRAKFKSWILADIERHILWDLKRTMHAYRASEKVMLPLAVLSNCKIKRIKDYGISCEPSFCRSVFVLKCSRPTTRYASINQTCPPCSPLLLMQGLEWHAQQQNPESLHLASNSLYIHPNAGSKHTIKCKSVLSWTKSNLLIHGSSTNSSSVSRLVVTQLVDEVLYWPKAWVFPPSGFNVNIHNFPNVKEAFQRADKYRRPNWKKIMTCTSEGH